MTDRYAKDESTLKQKRQELRQQIQQLNDKIQKANVDLINVEAKLEYIAYRRKEEAEEEGEMDATQKEPSR